MTTSLLPAPALANTRPTEPRPVVEAFLAALAAGDVDAAAEFLDDAVVYVNVGLPPLRTRAKVVDALKIMERPSVGFEVYLHAVATDGPVVLTERTDVLTFGKVRSQFWVAGRFDVHDGKITLWRDAFDFYDVTRSVIRGVVGAFVPTLRPQPPASRDVAPGR